MRFVKEAVFAPQKCSIVPFIGGHQELGYIDTGNQLQSALVDPHVYLSVVGLREVAKQHPEVGLITREDHAAVAAENESLKHLLEQKDLELRELHAEVDAIHLIKGRGYTPTKKPGRKPAAKAA